MNTRYLLFILVTKFQNNLRSYLLFNLSLLICSSTRIYLINDPTFKSVLIKTSDCIHDAFDNSFILFIFCCFQNDHEIVLTIPNLAFC
jgi:hypothetical protein